MYVAETGMQGKNGVNERKPAWAGVFAAPHTHEKTHGWNPRVDEFKDVMIKRAAISRG